MKIKTKRCLLLTYAKFSLFLTGALLMAACTPRRAEILFLADIDALEDNPRVALALLDTTGLQTLRTFDQATRYLKKSLAQHYLQPESWPDPLRLEQALALFRASRAYEPLLESLCLAAEMYEHRKEKDNQIASLWEAIALCRNAADYDWLFFLYNHLSEMYLRQYDMVKYHQYQQAAHHCLSGRSLQSFNLKTQLLIAENYLNMGKTSEAVLLLESVEDAIGPTHICYTDCELSLGLAYLKKGKWEKSIRKLQTLVTRVDNEGDEEKTAICHMLLVEAYYRAGDKATAAIYRDKAAAVELSARHYRIQKDYYQRCADMAFEEKAYAEAARYWHILYRLDEDIICKLNIRTLDEVILRYEMRKEREEKAAYEAKLYLLIGFLVVGICGAIAIYGSKRKKYRQRKWELAQQIEVLQKIKDTEASLRDELTSFIVRDFEIAKKIALLQQLQNEDDRRFLSKLNRLFLTGENKLLSLDWQAFYQHVDIYKHNFYTRLTAAYPILSEKEVQLSCMLMVGFNTSEMAAIWSQSVYSVHKCKTAIRKKMELSEGADLVAEFSTRLGLQG